MQLVLSISDLILAAVVTVRGALAGGGDLFVASWSAFSRQAAAIAVTGIWQGALIACGLAICLRFTPRTSAEHRFTLWAAAFATIVSLPLFALISSFQSGVVAGVSASAPMLERSPWFSIDVRWGLAITALWAVAALYRGGDLAVHSFRLRKLWKDAKPVETDDCLHSLPTSAVTARLRGSVQVCTTTTLQRPSVIGFFKPRILIPDWLLARLTPGELEQIVLHEAEHLRRRDDWTNLLQKICMVLFPLNPALVWIERRLCREREMACDEGVVRITRAPRAYAACLASLAERGIARRAEALSLGAWQRRPELVHRVHSILRGKHTLGPQAARVLMSVLGCGLFFGSIELVRCPQLIAFVPAQNREKIELQAHATAPAGLRDSSARQVKAAYVLARSGEAGHAVSGSSGTKLAAVSAAESDSELSEERGAIEQGERQPEVPLVRKTLSYKSNASSAQAVQLKAELANSNPAPVREQQWIVFTAWEQIQTSGQGTGVTADYEMGANANAQGEAQNDNARNAQAGSQLSRQITITRLILRIYPARSNSAQQASAPMRGGWFAIQL